MKTTHAKVFNRIFCCILTLFAFQQNIFSQIHPGSGGGAPQANAVPNGWTLDTGSPDISDATQWGYNGQAWSKTIPPIPNGETTFMTAHSTEVASMIITGLTPGNSYTLVFYYMAATNSQPELGGYGSLLSSVIRYGIDGNNVSRSIAAEATWYKEDVVFTASGTTAKFTFHGGSHDGFFPGMGSTEGDLTNISFAPNSVVPSVGVPPSPGCNLSIYVNSTTICDGQSALLIANGATTYVWSTGYVGDTLRIDPSTTTTYSVTGTSDGCSASTAGKVTVIAKPTVDFNYNPKSAGTIDPVITFSDNASPDVNYWYWDFGDGNTLPSFIRTNPVHAYSGKDSTYIVTLTVRNLALCENSVSHTVVINKEFSFYIPNAFSPNNDDLNDEFGARGKGIEKFQLWIFDRWGKLFFTANEISKTWNGEFDNGGEIAQQDVYVWKVKLTDIYKNEHDLTGTVTLLGGN